MRLLFLFAAFAAQSVQATEQAPKIHVRVALADNQYQGIIPVPASIGNGQDPKSNLYWGARYGMKTFFKQSPHWKFLRNLPAEAPLLERVVFEHRKTGAILLAEAYDGRAMSTALSDFAHALEGDGPELIAFVGHNGLMDKPLELSAPLKPSPKPHQAVVLACVSRSYFTDIFRKTGAKPLLWTASLMAPEAYILDSALDAWLLGKSDAEILESGRAAYAKYQKISKKGAARVLVSGFQGAE